MREIQAYTVTCRTVDATAALQHEIQNGMVTFEADGQEGQPKDRIYVTPIVFRTMHQIKINMLDGKASCMDDNDYLDTVVESAFLQKGFKVTAKLVQYYMQLRPKLEATGMDPGCAPSTLDSREASWCARGLVTTTAARCCRRRLRCSPECPKGAAMRALPLQYTWKGWRTGYELTSESKA